MGFLLEIAIDYFGWILGKKSQDAFSKGDETVKSFQIAIFAICHLIKTATYEVKNLEIQTFYGTIKGSKREAYILLSIFLILIVVMALFSLAWVIGFFNQ